jgi:hypothetical protein
MNKFPAERFVGLAAIDGCVYALTASGMVFVA